MTHLVESEPVATVTSFLRALEKGDIAAAVSVTAPGFTMQFPGGVTFKSFEALIAWAQGRYTGIRKAFERIDAAGSGDSAVVHVSGTLSGRWPDGTEFGGIRFIDRFDLTGGLIVRQAVWNDLGEAKLKKMSTHGAAISDADSAKSAPGGTGAAGA